MASTSSNNVREAKEEAAPCSDCAIMTTEIKENKILSSSEQGKTRFYKSSGVDANSAEMFWKVSQDRFFNNKSWI